jgi:hypothetical protein
VAIHVGSILGDAGSKCEAFMAILIIWHKVKNSCPCEIRDSDGALDLVFRVEGKLVSLDFHGIRTGRFSKKEKTLQIQIAVPATILSSPPIAEFVTSSIRQGVVLGHEYLKKKNVPFDLEGHLALLDKISDKFLRAANDA